MKKLIIAITIISFSTSLYAQHHLEMLWQTDSTLKAPESVRYDPGSKIFYVSNIGEFSKNGTGSISKVSPDGKIIKNDWVTGLTAPKGLGLYKNQLYAAEHKSVAVIDVTTGAVVQRIPVEGAEMLNDITIDSKGIVYVTDSRTSKVHRIENGKPSVYLENMKGANGVLAAGNDLYILTGTTLQKADAGKKLTTLADGIEGGADGIEMFNNNEFIVTGWEGTVYYVKNDGSKELLLDTRPNKTSAADLWFDPENKVVYIPAMSKNTLVAYKLK